MTEQAAKTEEKEPTLAEDLATAWDAANEEEDKEAAAVEEVEGRPRPRAKAKNRG